MGDQKASERGAALVETALLSIFLLILLTGILDVGRAIFTRIAIEDAAQVGAQFASFADPISVSDIEARVISSVETPELTSPEIAVACFEDASGSSRAVRRVEVTITHDLPIVSPAIGIFTDFITIRASAASERFAAAHPCPGPPNSIP